MKKFISKVGTRLAVIVFFVFTVCLYGPYSIFLPNAEELWFTLSAVNQIVLPVSAIAFGLLFLLSIIIPDSKYHIFTKLFFGLTLALYIQGNYINISYGVGVQDGTEIVWSDYTWYAIVDTLVWVLCLAIPFIIDLVVKKNNKTFRKAIIYASLFLTIIQIPAFATQALTYHPNQNTDLRITTENMFEISDTENILIFMVDTMDEKFYKTFIETYPEYEEKLTGFVHYDNTVAAGSRTIVGVPAMFTGVPYTRQETYGEYLSTVWSKPNAFSALNSAGYEVDVYSQTVLFSTDTIDYIANFKSGGGEVGSMSVLAKKLYKMDLYKFFPHLLKSRFWYTTAELEDAKKVVNDFKCNDFKFYDSFLESGFTVNSNKDKVFQLYHLDAAHSPFTMDEYGKKTDSTTRDQQVAGTFYRINQMLDDLKAKGLYDDATIMIVADHGGSGLDQHSTFLLKEAGSTGAYRTSSVPVSGFDLAPYLASFADVELTGLPYSEDLTKLEEDTVRERHFFLNTSGNSRLQIREYVSSGSATDEWTVDAIHDDTWAMSIPAPIGQDMSFTEDATANRYSVEGFGNNTGFRTRLFGPYVKMQIPVENIPESGELTVYFKVYNKLLNKVSMMTANANGIPLFNSNVDKKLISGGITLPVPVESFGDDGILTVEFFFPELDESEMDKPVEKRTETISLVSFRIDVPEQETQPE